VTEFDRVRRRYGGRELEHTVHLLPTKFTIRILVVGHDHGVGHDHIRDTDSEYLRIRIPGTSASVDVGAEDQNDFMLHAKV
jgi:hypothetical protein